MKRSIVTVGIIGLVAGFIACGNGTTNVSPKTCDCPEITHLEPGQTCPCGADNCKCTLKVNDQLSNSGITIWKEVEVELNDFQQIVEDFKKIMMIAWITTGGLIFVVMLLKFV